MSFIYALPVLLLAVIYRLIRAHQQGSWRSYGFNTAVIALCLATSANALRQQLDNVTGAPNLANLLSHVFLIIAAVGAVSYFAYLVDGRPSPRVRAECGFAGLLIATEVVLWSAARPLHGPESIPNLIYIRDPLVVLYSAVFYAYLLSITFRLGIGCLSQVTRRRLRRSASLGAIGVGALAEAPVTAGWLLTTLSPRTLSPSASYALHTFGGLGLIGIGLGVVMLALPASWWHALGSLVFVLQVLPLWRVIRRRYPIVALTLQTRNPGFIAQRAIIEIQDGLALARFDLPADACMSDLAHAIKRGRAGATSAMVLFASESSDQRAVARLGRCYWRELLRSLYRLSAQPRAPRGAQPIR